MRSAGHATVILTSDSKLKHKTIFLKTPADTFLGHSTGHGLPGELRTILCGHNNNTGANAFIQSPG